MPGVAVYFMQSSGGLTRAERLSGKDAILSGPAGGIVGMVRTAAAAGHERLIGFDMGGTSTDVSHFAGEYERVLDTTVAGVRVRAPMLAIETIAAGGGSIIRFDGARLRVGPESAGADPGPACYGRGGPVTITDANVLLGRIQPDYFPRVFGAAANEPLDSEVVAARFAELAAVMTEAAGRRISAEDVASGAILIAIGSMASAVKRISVARGHDVMAYTLQCFGGAAGQHACAVADALGLSGIFIHRLAGVLSAYGMGLADQHAMAEASLERELDEPGLAAAKERAAALVSDATARLQEQGVATAAVKIRRTLYLRYRGTDSALACELSPAPREPTVADELQALREDFARAYRRRFAHAHPNRSLVIEAVSVECSAAGESLAVPPALLDTVEQSPAAHAQVPMYVGEGFGLQGGWARANLYVAESLRPGAAFEGPAIVADRNATTVVDAGWRASVAADGSLELRRVGPRATRRDVGTHVDPVMLEVFNHLFMNVAEQMGWTLQSTAHSVNIKERLDFSCALFDASGRLIANAPHMPVHLGSMGESIRTVIDRNPAAAPGDVFLLNDPYHGGTHLPDMTVVTPVFIPDATGAGSAGAGPSFYVASRGHHADVGGSTPGSMPPFSGSIHEEGVLIDNFPLVARGGLREPELRALLAAGPHPARNPEQNLADLQAQIAANEKGADELRALVARYGAATIGAYMNHVRDNAEQAVRRAIGALRNGGFVLGLDNGAMIRVVVRVDAAERSATIDFTGSSAQLPNNFNAPRAVTMAAVLYVFRTLVDDEIPLNDGCLRPLQVIAPEGSMLNPRFPAAVVAGNVETSTCVTNALYGALGVMAAGQCTMNNLTFGNARHQYYETIAGGSGAGPGFAGTSMVQTHMTNSHLTDPEVLELRFPVRLECFEIRANSGGMGRWRGGDGGLRRIRFLEAMTASILSNGREAGAFGMAGGAPGEVGSAWVERGDGRIEPLGHIGQAELAAGDAIVICTPGGGGYGA
jgi:5-oxoprolinase (ATP-hydrolysing)